MKAIDYGDQTVCFKTAVFQAKPGPAHIWTSLEAGKNATAETCSKRNRYSWLLHQYNQFNVEKWGLASPAGAPPASAVASAVRTSTRVAPPVLARPSITLIARKGDNMRVFANEGEVIEALRGVPGAGEVRVVDFASIPFQEQLAVAHNTRCGCCSGCLARRHTQQKKEASVF